MANILGNLVIISFLSPFSMACINILFSLSKYIVFNLEMICLDKLKNRFASCSYMAEVKLPCGGFCIGLSRKIVAHVFMTSKDLQNKICSKHNAPRLCIGKSTQSTKIQSSGWPSINPSEFVLERQ